MTAEIKTDVDLLKLMRVWDEGLDLEYCGIRLGQALTYDLVQLARRWLGFTK